MSRRGVLSLGKYLKMKDQTVDHVRRGEWEGPKQFRGIGIAAPLETLHAVDHLCVSSGVQTWLHHTRAEHAVCQVNVSGAGVLQFHQLAKRTSSWSGTCHQEARDRTQKSSGTGQTTTRDKILSCTI